MLLKQKCLIRNFSLLKYSNYGAKQENLKSNKNKKFYGREDKCKVWIYLIELSYALIKGKYPY